MSQRAILCAGQRTAVVVAVVLSSFVGGCASLDSRLARADAASSAPLPAGMARVCLIRQAHLLGAKASHNVLDCGGNIEFDSRIIEKGQITYGPPVKGLIGTMQVDFKEVAVSPFQQPKEANKGYVGRVDYLVLPRRNPVATNHNIWLHVPLINGRAAYMGRFPLGVFLSGDGGQAYLQLPYGSGEGVFLGKAVVSDATDLVKPNARHLGSVGSGDALTFDRPAGVMRLRLVTPSGDVAVAPDFAIVAGKKYLVDYFYGFSGVNFTLIERP